MAVFFGAHNITSPLGFTTRQNFDALLAGKTALQKHYFSFSASPFFCSKLKAEDLQNAFSKIGAVSNYTDLEKLCILSISDVIEQSGIELSDKKNLLILSTTKGNIDLLENRYPALPQDRVYLPKFAKCIGGYFNAVNTPLVVSNACISGLLAIIIAKRLIENQSYKNIVVCGADLVSEFTLSGFKSFNAMSDTHCKPFDANRNGINLGEGAASIVLSEDPIGKITIVSGASANDANHISGPSRNGDGLYQCITETLQAAGQNSVDLVSAHGTATEYNDEMEAMAFSRSHLNEVPLNSLKGYFGHTLGAAGVIESIVSIQSLLENKLIKSLGFSVPGTSQPLNIITSTQENALTSCLKTASGFGGCNAAAILKKL